MSRFRTVRPVRDEGSVTVLTLGLVVALLAVIAVVTDASAVFLARRGIAAACDAAAVAAAQGVDREVLYAGGGGDRLPLSLPAARERAAEWLAAQDDPALQVVVTGLDAEATTAELSCSRIERPPLRAVVDLEPVTVVAHAEARSPFSR